MEDFNCIGYPEKGLLLQRTISDPRRGGEGIYMAKHTINSTYLIGDQQNNTYYVKNNAKIVYRYNKGRTDDDE